MIKLEDLPVPSDQVGDQAYDMMSEDDNAAEAILIIGQLDALELVDGQPRWSPEQQKLILTFADTLKEWRDS